MRYTLQQRTLIEQIENIYYNKEADTFPLIAFTLLEMVQCEEYELLEKAGIVYEVRGETGIEKV